MNNNNKSKNKFLQTNNACRENMNGGPQLDEEREILIIIAT